MILGNPLSLLANTDFKEEIVFLLLTVFYFQFKQPLTRLWTSSLFLRITVQLTILSSALIGLALIAKQLVVTPIPTWDLLRMENSPNAAHSLVWITLIAFFFLAVYCTNNVFKALVLEAFILSLHELYWNIFYTVSISYSKIAYDQLPDYFMSIVLLCSNLMLCYLLLRKELFYYAVRVIPVLTVYFSIWLYYFHFQITIDSVGTTLHTIYYSNPLTNNLEILSWCIMTVVSALTLVQLENSKQTNRPKNALKIKS